MALHSKYKFLEHPADIKIKAYGYNLPELFINAAVGMMQYVYGKNLTKKTKIDGVEQIEVTAENLESLLINWLAKILALGAINRCAYVTFTIKEFNAHKIIAEIGSIKKSKAYNEIKAVTYHELDLKSTKNGWVATVVFDI